LLPLTLPTRRCTVVHEHIPSARAQLANITRSQNPAILQALMRVSLRTSIPNLRFPCGSGAPSWLALNVTERGRTCTF
jgi:hypothetical protein